LAISKVLQIVNVRGNSIGNKGFKELVDILPLNMVLRSLNLERNLITAAGINYLSKLI